MFLKVSAPLFLKATVPRLLVTVLLCEKVDIFTVRPSWPNLSIVWGHNCFLVIDYLCHTISTKSTTAFAGQSLKKADNAYNKYTVLTISWAVLSPKKIFSALRASAWSRNKGGGGEEAGPPGPSRDPPLIVMPVNVLLL